MARIRGWTRRRRNGSSRRFVRSHSKTWETILEGGLTGTERRRIPSKRRGEAEPPAEPSRVTNGRWRRDHNRSLHRSALTHVVKYARPLTCLTAIFRFYESNFMVI